MTTWLGPHGGTAERMGEKLRQRLAGGGSILRAPGAHDAMAGLIARGAGFDVLYVSGAAVTASRGLPDLGVLTMEELTGTVRSIARATGLPLIVHTRDADDDTAAILRQEMQAGAFTGLIHCFSSGRGVADAALELGEERPDYIFFGRFGYDTKPEPHARNLALGAWWAQMIEIPCIVMAGSEIASVAAVAATGAEFVALSAAVFADGVDAGAAVAEANALLDRTAQRFEAP